MKPQITIKKSYTGKYEIIGRKHSPSGNDCLYFSDESKQKCISECKKRFPGHDILIEEPSASGEK